MKKFMAGCAITALVLVVLGLGMSFVTGTIKGRQTIHDVVEAVTDGRVQVRLNDISDWGVTIGESISNEIENELGEVHYDLEDAMVFDNTHEVFGGDVEKYSLGKEIYNLEIEVGGCAFVVAESGDDNYYLEAENTKRFQGYVEDGTLYVRGTSKNQALLAGEECQITLYVPANWAESGLREVDMELGAGVMELGRIGAKQVHLEVGAGQITIAEVIAEELELTVGMGEILVDNFTTHKLDGEVGMGHLFLKGDVKDSAEVECAMGAIEMVVKGSRNDFNYDVECGMGNISLGQNNYGGVAQEQSINNNASKSMSVECAMGDISISYAE